MRRYLLLVAVLTGCKNPPEAPAVPATLQVVSGANQSGIPGYRLATPISVKLVDDRGDPVAGQVVKFSADDQYAFAEPDSAVTDASGIATTNWRLGPTLGTQTLRASTSMVNAPSISAAARSNTMISIDGGDRGLCGIDAQGRLNCWLPPTRNVSDPASTLSPAAAPVQFTQVTIPVEITGTVGGCALATTGRVWCFTLDAAAHVIGLAELAGSYPALTQIVSGDEQATYCGLTADGQAWCWGTNDDGQLGDGTRISRAAPSPVQTAARFVQLDVDNTACGLTADGSAWCWGRNTSGETGVAPAVPSLTPVLVSSPVKFSKVRVDTYESASCGIAAAGGLYCWGDISKLASSPVTTGSPTTTATLLNTVSTPIDLFESSGVTFVFGRSTAVQWTGDYYDATEGGEGFATHLFQGALMNVIRDVQLVHGRRYVCGTAILGGGMLCPSTEGLIQVSPFQSSFTTLPPVVGIPFP